MNDDLYARVLADLIAIDTTSSRSNLAFIDHVEDFLRGVDCRMERIPGETPDKSNLWISIGPEDRPGYVLSGHSDTVSVEGQDWTGSPYRLRSANGRLYGRGTSDMKGFLAVCLAHVREMASAPLTRPIHLAISCDEEIGCRGVPSLLARVMARPNRPLGCFVGEPTNMNVVTGHKGKRAYKATVSGSWGHSSVAPRHVNAVEWAARLVDEIRKVGCRIATQWPQDPRYDIPHSTLLSSTIQGGTAVNIVPGSCTLEWEIRMIPADEDARVPEMIMEFARDKLVPLMQAKRDDAGIQFDETIAYPGLDMADEHPLVQLASRLSGKNELRRVAYGTEAGLFDKSGIPAVVIGPGSIEQAHKADEYIEMSELVACGRFVSGLIADSCR